MEFKNVEEASQRWISEGKAYKNAINDWLDIIYIDKKQPESECPEETRKDMDVYVKEQIIAFNQEGKLEELRQLFPPDNDPMDWKDVTGCVSQVAILQDNRLIVTINEWYQDRFMYLIDNNSFTLIDNVIMFGKSFDKKYFAKVYENKIEVTEGWEGKIIKTFNPPKNYGAQFEIDYPTIKQGLAELNFNKMRLHQVVVFPSGQKIAIASKVGIFILDDNGSQFIQTEDRIWVDRLKEYNKEDYKNGFTFTYDYPHIDVSPDEKYVVVGSQSSSHLVLQEESGVWKTLATVDQRSEYPNLAKFNYKIADSDETNTGPQLLLCSCHFRKSASIALPIKNIKQDFFASGYDADDTLNYVDDKKWVFAIGNYSWGYALGCNDGYVWFKHYLGFQFGYLHVGGSVMDIDFSDDRKTMVVASYSGQVILYNVELFNSKGIFRLADNKEEKRLDDFAITNTSLKDKKRYLFWRGHDPMVW